MGDHLILSHGAGSNRNAPLLVAVDRALTRPGVSVTRIDLPFREKRPSGPPRQGDPERDREAVRRLAESSAQAGDRTFLAGHSYGGRQSSMVAAEHPGLVAGLLLLSYPLHPPRRPAELRTAHFPDLCVPCLFVHGTRDPFGSVEELRAAITLIPAPVRLVEIPGAGHDLSGRAAHLETVADRIGAEFRTFFAVG